MADSNKNNGPACPGDDFLAKSDSDDTNELLNIITKQPPEGAGLSGSSSGGSREEEDPADSRNAGPAEATGPAGAASSSQGGGQNGVRGAVTLGDAVAAGRGFTAGAAGSGNATQPAAQSDGQPAGPYAGQHDAKTRDSALPLEDASPPASGQSRSGGAPNPGWGRAVHGAASDREVWGHTAGQAAGQATSQTSSAWGNVPPGGAWVWLPQGVEQKKSWRRRHPFLFWGGLILLLALVFGVGRMSGEESPLGGPKIAVINVEGMILDADAVVSFMEKVRKDDSYKGAVLRINSPGGAVGPSQEIYAAAKRLAEKKPLVASMGALAASGGYYAALGSKTILAGPSTLTASIGVKMQIPNLEELMRTVGISEKTLTTGALKDAGSSWRTMSSEEEDYFMALLTDMYEEFIETVARERDMSLDEVRALADGRAMTGRQALAAGLVDGMGDKQEAVRRVKSMAGLNSGPVRLVSGPEKPGSYLSELMKSAMQSVLNERAGLEQPRFFY